MIIRNVKLRDEIDSVMLRKSLTGTCREICLQNIKRGLCIIILKINLKLRQMRLKRATNIRRNPCNLAFIEQLDLIMLEKNQLVCFKSPDLFTIKQFVIGNVIRNQSLFMYLYYTLFQ